MAFWIPVIKITHLRHQLKFKISKMDFREDLGVACSSKLKFTENVQKSIQKNFANWKIKKKL